MLKHGRLDLLSNEDCESNGGTCDHDHYNIDAGVDCDTDVNGEDKSADADDFCADGRIVDKEYLNLSEIKYYSSVENATCSLGLS